MSHYDCRIVYLKGEDNSIADTLSCTEFPGKTLECLEGQHIVNELVESSEATQLCIVGSRVSL
jgi:hypothetical protein